MSYWLKEDHHNSRHNFCNFFLYIHYFIVILSWVNPVSPNSDQQQLSPNNIHTLSRDNVVWINKMIIIEKIPWSFIKFSQLILKRNVWRSVWRICMWILGPKGLIMNQLNDLHPAVGLLAHLVEHCTWIWCRGQEFESRTLKPEFFSCLFATAKVHCVYN